MNRAIALPVSLLDVNWCRANNDSGGSGMSKFARSLAIGSHLVGGSEADTCTFRLCFRQQAILSYCNDDQAQQEQHGIKRILLC